MGQQQMFLIILGVVITGIAIAVGIWLFGASSVSSNKDAIINDLNHLGSTALQYRVRIPSMGGGGGSYAGYKIPSKLVTNDDASFSASVQPQSVTFTGTSALGYGDVQAVLDSTGKLTSFTYTGEFQ